MILMPYKLKGELAIFLALIFSSILLFLLTIIYGVRNNLIKSEVAVNSELSLRACFAEYNKDLFEDFHIMYIDPSYGYEEGEEEITKEHYRLYFLTNMNSGEGFLLSDINYDEIEFTRIVKARDEGYKNLMDQINIYSGKGQQLSEKEILLEYIRECIGSIKQNEKGDLAREEYEYLLCGEDSSLVNRDMAVKKYMEEYTARQEGIMTRYSLTDYEDYLMKSLDNMDKDILMSRLINIINNRIRSYGNEYFNLDDCICQITVRTHYLGSKGLNASFEYEYGYLNAE